jgi:biotin transport system substrate-specific component
MIGASGRRMVLAERAWPRAGLARDAALIVGGALLTALCSQIVIPLQPVPITGQTFGVLLVGSLLGSRRGAASMFTYFGAGAIGLPVFAGGAAGLARLTGPTAGYLVGFVAAATLVGFLSQRGWDRQVATTAVAMALGTLMIYAFGVIWLSRFVGWRMVLAAGVFPFLVGDGLKLGLAALVLPWAWKLMGENEAS